MKKLNQELAGEIGHIAGTLGKMGKVYNHMAETYGGASGGASMFEVFGSLGELFSKMKESCNQLEGMFVENFDKFFRYHARELASVEDLLVEWHDGRSQYVKMYKRLKEKKELMYSQRQMDKWEVDEKCKYPLEVLLKNKDIAFSQMLPEETSECEKCKYIYGYYCNKVPEEFQRVCQKSQPDYRIHLMEVAQMNCQIFERVKIHV